MARDILELQMRANQDPRIDDKLPSGPKTRLHGGSVTLTTPDVIAYNQKKNIS